MRPRTFERHRVRSAAVRAHGEYLPGNVTRMEFRWRPDPIYTADEVRAIAPGAFYILLDVELGSAPATVDDLTYPGMKFTNKFGLKRMWGIKGHDDAMAAVSALVQGMHAPEFDTLINYVYPAVHGSAQVKQQTLQALSQEYGSDKATEGAEFIAALELPDMPSMPASTYAYDLVRMAMIARRTAALGWVTPQEVLPILNDGVQQARSVFSGWEEFGVSFVVGRALWASDGEHYTSEESLQSTLPMLRTLLSAPDSPWVRLPW